MARSRLRRSAMSASCAFLDRRRPVDHADDPAPAVRDRHEDVNRVGGCAEDGADLRHGLERVQHVDGEAFSEQDHERVPRADRQRVRRCLPGQLVIVTGPAHEPRSPGLAERQAEPQMRLTPASASCRSSTVLMKCAWPMMTFMSARLSIGNHFEGHRTRFHELVIPGGMATAPGCADELTDHNAESDDRDHQSSQAI